MTESMLRWLRGSAKLNSQSVKTKRSLGWVNVYSQNGRLRFSCSTFHSRKWAIINRKRNSISTYLGAIELFADTEVVSDIKMRNRACHESL